MEFAFLLVAIATLLLQISAARHVPHEKCVKGVHIIATRGDSTKEPPYGGLTTTIGNVTDAIYDSNASPNSYPIKDPVPLDAIVKGTHHLISKVKNYAAKCPKTKIVLMGYSDGAVITMNAMCGFSALGVEHIDPLPNKYADNIIAAIIYGDESRKAGESYNRGTCVNNGIRPRQQAQCGPFHNKIRSFCSSHDPLCCVGGLKMQAHYGYPNKYDHTSTEFVIQEYDHHGA